MTSIDESKIVTQSPDVATTVPPATRTEDLVTELCGTAMVQGAEGGRRAATGIAGLTLATVVVSIFVGYALAFFPAQALQPYHQHALTPDEAQTAALGAASYLVTTALIVVPLLLEHRRRATP